MKDDCGAIYFKKALSCCLGFVFIPAALELHRLPATGDIAHARLIAILDDFKLDAALIATQYLIRLDRFHKNAPFVFIIKTDELTYGVCRIKWQVLQ